MYPFSMGGAWSKGVGFLKARPWQHLLLLGGLALVVPFALQLAIQYALTGAILGPAARPAEPSLAYQLAPALALMLQAGGFFAAWRLGLGERESLSGALRYGVLAGLVAAAIGLVLLVAAGLAASGAGSRAFGLFVLIFTLAPLILLLALFSTLAAALLGVAMALAVTIVMLYGLATGDPGLAATMVGGSGFVAVLLLLLSVVLLWLAGRLCCATAFMADRKSYNLLAAVRASWEITGDEQWRIMRYLALIGAVLLVFLVAAFAAIGGGVAALQFASPEMPRLAGIGVGFAFASLFVGLAAGVPAGVYLQLMGERAPVDVFA